MLNEKNFILKCSTLISSLNETYNSNVKFSFKEEELGWFTYDPASHTINCDPKILHDKKFIELYKDYYIHAVLHEYGHAYYSNKICSHLLNCLNNKAFEEHYHVRIIDKMINDLIIYGGKSRTYVNLLKSSCSEFFADYFVHTHNHIYTNTNISKFLQWRTNEVYNSYQEITNLKQLYISHSQFHIYFPIPILFYKIDLNINLSFYSLFELWMEEYQEFLIMFYNQIYENDQKINFLNQQLKILSDFKLVFKFLANKNEKL